jgi:mannose-1-phosphate guanylyltransferase/mannose-6-phosphate isomerase
MTTVVNDKMTKGKFQDYMITSGGRLLSALEKVDLNKQGFLIVVDHRGKVLGTLTDGDIRRGLLRGLALEGSIDDCYTRDFSYVNWDGAFADVIAWFKKRSIDFLPILDREGRLGNLITKSHFHALMLQNIDPDLSYPFMDVDDAIVFHEIFDRPWGFYKTTVLNDLFQSKVLSIKPGAALSLQMHKKREEHWVVVNGVGEATLGESVILVKAGDHLFIPKACKHRLVNTGETENLLVAEVQLGDYFGEDDIIRFDDVYGRMVHDEQGEP